MRADIHDGPEQMLQSKAGYIDARPLTANPTNLLATHGRTIHSGQSRRFGGQPPTSGLPLETDIFTAGRHVSKVPKAEVLLFNHLVGSKQQRSWNGYTKRTCGLEVDEKLNLFGQLHDGQIGGLCALENFSGVYANLLHGVT
jgi:hypothetical protein